MLDDPPTKKQAIIDAGLDWRVLEEPAYQLHDSLALRHILQLQITGERSADGTSVEFDCNSKFIELTTTSKKKPGRHDNPRLTTSNIKDSNNENW